MWVPGSRRRAARKDAVRRAEVMRAEMVARRRIEEELAVAGTDRPPRRSTVRRLAFRGRKILLPFLLLAVLFGAGLASVHAAVLAMPALWLLACLAWWWRRGRQALDRAVERRYAAVCVAAGAVWLLVAHAGIGPFWLAVGLTVAAAPWWQHHWPRGYEHIPEQVHDETIVDLWNRYVADPGGPLPAAELLNPGMTANSQTWWVQLRRGRQDIASARSALSRISTGLDVPMHRLLFDPVPKTEMAKERPSVVRFQIVVNSPIEETVYFDRPRWRDGRILLGPHADGDGEASWRLYTENSMWSGYVLGSTGSGKTRLIESIVLTARAMPVKPITVYIDGQSGASSPTLWKHATWRGGPDEALDMLAGLERGLRLRQKWNVAHGLSGFTPGFCPDGAEQPLTPVLIVVDECQRIYPQAAPRWGNLTREQRKCGMGEVAASHGTSLGDAFGGDDPLRSSLLAGNGIAMRTTSRLAVGLFPGLGGDDGLNPVDFPNLPGYGYKVAVKGSGERTTGFRGRHLPDAKNLAETEAAGGRLPVPTIEEWFAKTPDGVLDEMTARAFGPVFLDRHALAEAATQAARDEIEGRTPIVVDRPAVVEDDSTTRGQVLVELAKRSPLRPVELETLTGKSKSGVKQVLTALRADGLIERLTEKGDDGYSLGYVLVTAAVPAA